MDKNLNSPKSNNSMFLYTALIFAVALILIILAFFGQTNISSLRRTGEQANAPESAATAVAVTAEATAVPQQETLARMANTLSGLETENEGLKEGLATYEALLRANAYISSDSFSEAAEELNNINAETLTEDQSILYNNLIDQINEREEQ